VSSGDIKFFFEEDTAEVLSSGVSTKEQADIFGEVLEELGISGAPDSMEPMEATMKKMVLREMKTTLLHIEYGIVDKDYVLHITPVHPKRNFQGDAKLRLAIQEVILILNKIVPFDLKVSIHLPREDWEVKALSFVVRQGAVAWNLRTEELDTAVTEEVEPKLAALCMRP